MLRNTGVAVVAACVVLAGARPVLGQRGAGADTIRPLTVEEYQAQRRQWLEARRLGQLGTGSGYGSAVVGAPGIGSGFAGAPLYGPVPGLGGAPANCRGWSGAGAGLDGRVGRAGGLRGGGQRGAGSTRGRDGSGNRSGGSGRGDNTGRPGLNPGWGMPGLGYGAGNCNPWMYSPWGGPGGGVGDATGYGWGYPGAGFPGIGGGVDAYGWGYYGYMPLYPFGFQSGPAGGYRFSWPGMATGECARVSVELANGVRYDVPVGLETVGLARASDLDLAIDERLSRGESVTLYGLDGRVLRLYPGLEIADIRVSPCDSRR